MDGSWVAPVALGLASAACWGAADFSGGLATRRTAVYAVIIASQVVGTALLIVLALAIGERMPPAGDMVGGAVAGLAGGLGLAMLYRSLASGRMGVAAPVSAVLTAALPVILGASAQGLPRTVQMAGFALALAGIWLIARTEGAEFRWRDLGLPIAAGAGFGVFLILVNRVSSVSTLWPLLPSRVTSLGLMFGVATATSQPRRLEWRLWPLAALAGILDTGGNTFYALASHAGRLDVAAVLSSLYPASTVLLASVILKERISRLQMAGIVAALAAIVMIAV